MADMLELRVLHVVGHHDSMVGRGVRVAREGALVVIVVVVVAIFLSHEVLGTLVFVGSAIVLEAANGVIDVA